MYFNKVHDPANCSFPVSYDPARSRLVVGRHSLKLALTDLGDDVFRVRIEGKPWPHQYSQVKLDVPRLGSASRCALRLGPRGELELFGADGGGLLSSVMGQSFGVCGSAWLFHFQLPGDAQHYGMGEKGVGFERSG